jgi:nucleotide-binding universal stress UspA family protein
MDEVSEAGTELLVPIDHGEGRYAALDRAVAEALATGEDLRLLHVVHPVSEVQAGDDGHDGDLMASGHTLLDNAVAGLRLEGHRLRVRTEVMRGLPLEVIMEEARRARKVFLQRRHLCALDSVINGPIVAGVAAHAPVPVVIVPEAFSGSNDAHHRQITVALKPDEPGADLLERAFGTARQLNAPLRVLRVVRPLRLHGVLHGVHLDNERSAESGQQASRKPEGAQHLQLSGQIAVWRDRFPDVPVHVEVVRGRPAVTLLEATADSDLLLIARPHSLTPAGALGILSRALIREAACPVEVVPTQPRAAKQAVASPRHGADAWGPIY